MGYVNNNNKELNPHEIILGIDQSFSNTGFCVYDCQTIIEASCISTKNDKSLEERIQIIVKEMLIIIKRYDIKQVVIEGMSFASMQASIRQLAGLFYVILYELNKKKIKYDIIPPLTLKKAVTGSGKATKQEMIDKVELREQMILSDQSNIKIGAKKFEDIVDSYWLSRYYNL